MLKSADLPTPRPPTCNSRGVKAFFLFFYKATYTLDARGLDELDMKLFTEATHDFHWECMRCLGHWGHFIHSVTGTLVTWDTWVTSSGVGLLRALGPLGSLCVTQDALWRRLGRLEHMGHLNT